MYIYIHQIHLLPIKYYTIHTGTYNGLGTGLDGHLMKSTIDTKSIKTDIFDPYIQCKNTQKGEGVVPVLKYTERGGGRPGIKIHRKGRGSSRY